MSPINKEKLRAALDLLTEQSTSISKIQSAIILVRGLNQKVDHSIEIIEDAIKNIKRVEQGDIITLSVDQLPENDEEQKKRKKMLLLFIKSWKDLQSEVERVSLEMEHMHDAGTSSQVSSLARIFAGAQGPLALITVVAIGLVVLQTTSVSISIHNNNCGDLETNSRIPVSLPGFSLPKEPIISGESATATIFPLSLDIDGTESGVLRMKSIGMSITFSIGNSVSSVEFNGQELLGNKTRLTLSEKKNHMLTLTCI